MIVRVRTALPVAQVVVASLLIAANRQRPDSILSPAWNKPDIQVCHAINAPTAVAVHFLRQAIYNWMPNPHAFELVLETAVYVVLVWFTWFVVGAEIERGIRRLSAPVTGSQLTRAIAAVIFGAIITWAGLVVRHQFGPPDLYSNLLSLPYFIWGAAIVAFYGHEGWAGIRRRQAPNQM